MPRVEHDFFVGVVGMNGGNNALDRVVTVNGAYPNHSAELELLPLRKLAEKWFVLANRLALVVENGPAAADPAWIDHRPIINHGSRLRLNFLLDVAAKAVRVAECDLELALLALL